MLLYYVRHRDEVPLLVPVEVVSLQPDADGQLKLVEPVMCDDRIIERVPFEQCYEYDPYLAHAVQAYAAQISTLVRVSQSVIEGLGVPAVPLSVPAGGDDARVH